MERTVAYIRTATDNLEQLENQQASILKYVNENNIHMIKQFKDIAVPSKGVRQKQMLEYIKENKVDQILVYSLDRLGRNIEDVKNILDEINENGTKITFINPAEIG